MDESRMQILRMIAEGKVTAEEGQRLLQALERSEAGPDEPEPERRESPPPEDPFESPWRLSGSSPVLEAPEGSTLQVRSELGKVMLLGTDEPSLRVEGAALGHYELSRSGKEIRLRTRRPDASLLVHVPAAVTRVRVKTDVGEVAARDLACKELQIQTDVGPISAVLPEIHEGEVRISSDVGPIRVSLPATSSINLRAEVDDWGEVHTNLPLEIDEQGRGYLVGRLHGGGANIRLKADVTQIRIMARGEDDAGEEWSTGRAHRHGFHAGAWGPMVGDIVRQAMGHARRVMQEHGTTISDEVAKALQEAEVEVHRGLEEAQKGMREAFSKGGGWDMGARWGAPEAERDQAWVDLREELEEAKEAWEEAQEAWEEAQADWHEAEATRKEAEAEGAWDDDARQEYEEARRELEDALHAWEQAQADWERARAKRDEAAAARQAKGYQAWPERRAERKQARAERHAMRRQAHADRRAAREQARAQRAEAEVVSPWDVAQEPPAPPRPPEPPIPPQAEAAPEATETAAEREVIPTEPGARLEVQSDAGTLTLVGIEGDALIVESRAAQRYRVEHDKDELEVLTVGPGPGLTVYVPTTVERVAVTVRGGALVVRELDDSSFRGEPQGGEPVRWKWRRAEGA